MTDAELVKLADRLAAGTHDLVRWHFFEAEHRKAIVAALRRAAQQDGAKSLSDYSDGEIQQEWHNRAMRFLGDQRVGVGVETAAEFCFGQFAKPPKRS